MQDKLKKINIRFPLQDSDRGDFFMMNIATKDAVKSDLLHLLLTQKGTRFMKPDFGTNLYKYLFEPNDLITYESVREEIDIAVNKYIPNLKIRDMQHEIVDSELKVFIDFVITDGIFQESDTIELTF